MSGARARSDRRSEAICMFVPKVRESPRFIAPALPKYFVIPGGAQHRTRNPDGLAWCTESLIGVGIGFRRPRPPNRTGGFPAYGSPVGGFFIETVSLIARRCEARTARHSRSTRFRQRTCAALPGRCAPCSQSRPDPERKVEPCRELPPASQFRFFAARAQSHAASHVGVCHPGRCRASGSESAAR